MLSDVEIIDKVYDILNISAITTVITGDVYKRERPVKSDKEDVVINCLPTNNLDVQTAIVNVNIHVKNIDVKQNDVVNNVTNHSRLRILNALVMPYLTYKSFGNYWIDIEQQTTFSETEIKQSYSNIRVKFFFINL